MLGKDPGCLGEVSGVVLGAGIVVISRPKNRLSTGERDEWRVLHDVYLVPLAHGVMVVIWRGLGGGLGVKRRVGKERKGNAKSLTRLASGSTLFASPPNGYWQNGYYSTSGG
jgi:hypothetical protein